MANKNIMPPTKERNLSILNIRKNVKNGCTHYGLIKQPSYMSLKRSRQVSMRIGIEENV